MPIIENKLRTIAVIMVFYFILGFLVSAINSNYETWNPETTEITGENFSEITEQEEDWLDSASDVFEIILLQIEGAPAVVNGIMGFIAGVFIFMIGLIIAAFVREFIGLT